MTTTYTLQYAAKLLGVGPNKLFAQLRKLRVLNMSNMPYQRYIDAGYFTVDTRSWHHVNTGEHLYARTMVTVRGVEWIKKQIVPGEGTLNNKDGTHDAIKTTRRTTHY